MIGYNEKIFNFSDIIGFDIRVEHSLIYFIYNSYEVIVYEKSLEYFMINPIEM